MAADLNIHVFSKGELTEQDFRVFMGSTLGSKWCRPFGSGNPGDEWDRAYDKFSNTASVWIGSVSWLKAALLEDVETYVPGPVAGVEEIIGENWPTVDDELIGKIREAMNAENTTGYSVAQADTVCAFLEAHKGEMAFTVSW